MQGTGSDRPVPPGPPWLPAETPATRPSWRRSKIVWLAAVGVLVGALLVASLLVHLPYDVFTPGEAPDAASFIKIGAPGQAQQRAGSIHLTTVGVFYGVGPLQYITSLFNSKDAVVSEKDYPQDTAAEVAAMDESQRFASLAAFAELGDKNLPSNGALVTQVVLNDPAAKSLCPGDVVTSADGVTVTTADQLSPLVLAHQPGQTIHLTWQRADVPGSGCPQPTSIPASAACPLPTKAMSADVAVIKNASPPPDRVVGVASQPNYLLPVPVCINAGDIEGPSAGLSWALAIVNLLGPTDLTRGRIIADTGTMDASGAVGDIGGIAQKVYGALAQHATLFICPKDQAKDAQAAATKAHSSIKIIGVSTLHEAVQALAP